MTFITVRICTITVSSDEGQATTTLLVSNSIAVSVRVIGGERAIVTLPALLCYEILLRIYIQSRKRGDDENIIS